MYLALTYDHRLLDGREAVTFLVKVCHLICLIIKLTTDSVAGQGVHRGPPTHAARLIDSHRDLSILVDLFVVPRAAIGPYCRLSGFQI